MRDGAAAAEPDQPLERLRYGRQKARIGGEVVAKDFVYARERRGEAGGVETLPVGDDLEFARSRDRERRSDGPVRRRPSRSASRRRRRAPGVRSARLAPGAPAPSRAAAAAAFANRPSRSARSSGAGPDCRSGREARAYTPLGRRSCPRPASAPIPFPSVRRRGGRNFRPLLRVRRERRRVPVGASPTRRTLQPEATGAVMEVTKWLKPSV